MYDVFASTKMNAVIVKEKQAKGWTVEKMTKGKFNSPVKVVVGYL